jgi:hypothetical protein
MNDLETTSTVYPPGGSTTTTGSRASSCTTSRTSPGLWRPVTRLTFLHRGRDDRRRAEEAPGVHRPHYSAHGGAEALARQVTSLDVKDTVRVQNELGTLPVPARVVRGVADQLRLVEIAERR